MDLGAIAQYRTELRALEEDLARPELAANPPRLKELSRRHSQVAEIVAVADRIEACVRRIAESDELIRDASNDADISALAHEEKTAATAERAMLTDRLKHLLIPRDPEDSKNTIIEIRAGTGGEEASLFAAELYRMYTRYAERRGWKIESLNTSYAELGGLKEVIFGVQGDDVYMFLKYEGGVHRVQRV
ncbi:PCRF domain-containing protein, partial [bacterium]|nr:PCRF domain-containing protein [bacterium]